jgi:hypothetical protein
MTVLLGDKPDFGIHLLRRSAALAASAINRGARLANWRLANCQIRVRGA